MKIRLVFFIQIITFQLMAQHNIPPGQSEFMKRHYENLEIASEMFSYDHVAWVSSDSVQTLSKEEMSTYGGQWFCYLDSVGQYHALYGAYDSIFTLTAHYIVDSTHFNVNRSFQPFDTTLAITFSKAYNLSLSRKKQLLGAEDRLKYNHYIFKTDSTITVHYLPGYQSNGYLVYGAEMHYTLNLQADKILDTVEYFNEYRGYQPNSDQEISLGFEELGAPPISGLFFMMSYENYFKSIYLYTKNYLTTFIRNKDGEGTWIHAERKEPKKKKKKKKK